MGNKPTTILLHTGATSLGTGTTKTQLGGAAVILPQWAKTLVAIMPEASLLTPTAAQSLLMQADVESNDVTTLPFQVLAAPTSAALGSSFSTFTSRPEVYSMGVALPGGGEQINVYGTALIANTAAPYGRASLVVSNQPPAYLGFGRPRKAKVGTLTSTGTTASTDVAGTKYNISGAQQILELIGCAVPTTIATVKPITGYLKYTSSEFDGVSDCKLPLRQMSPGLRAAASTESFISTFIDGISRVQVQIPLMSGQVNIQDYAYFTDVPSTAGNWISGVIFE